MKVLSVVGARPQFVKLAPLSRRLRTQHDELIVHTGQHYDPSLSAAFFRDLDIPCPDVNLEVGSAPHGAQTGAMLAAIERLLLERRPDLVVVFGDTNSTLAGALAAAKLGIPGVHVEAGLRSFNRVMPEEINRVVADHTADRLFAPTAAAVENLCREGLRERTRLTGDIMVDALQENRQRASSLSRVLERLELAPAEYALLTLHRPYNVDDAARLAAILAGIAELDVPVVFPVHPRTQNVLERARVPMPPGILPVPPQGYLDFLQLQAHAQRVLTDSGGVQKEAYLLGVPCVTLRPETEWIETVAHGWNLLADPTATDFPDRVQDFRPSGRPPPVFGENVAQRMLEHIEELSPSR